MGRKIWPLALVILFPLLVLTGFAISPGLRQDAQSVVAQPANWVAFDAQFLQTQAGSPDIKGRYVRASDGSYRIEEQSTDGTLQTIWISNVPRAASYTYHNGPGKWFSRPLAVAADGRLRIMQRLIST